MSIRTEKFASTLQQTLAAILLTESENPRLKNVTISRVSVTADLRRACIGVSCPDGDVAERITELNRSAGFLKRQISRRMILKYMPELVFEVDDAFVTDMNIARILQGDPREGENR
jgi:ribosome-binding factor A